MFLAPIKIGTLKTLLVSVFFFNVIDGLLTLFFLREKLAEELNPLMDWAFTNSTVLFMSIKVFWIGLNLAILWRCRKSLLINVTWILFMIFACLLIYELVFLFCWLGAVGTFR